MIKQDDMTITDFSHFKAITFDVDGVMTDGGLLALPDGDLLRIYNAKDTFGIRMALMGGLDVAVITGGCSQALLKRFISCGVKEEYIYMHSRCKVKQFDAFCAATGIKKEDIVYVGDDIPDVDLLKYCGLGIAPADACKEAKEAADIVSDFPGGHGCIRDIVEKILKAQGRWTFDAEEYERKY